MSVCGVWREAGVMETRLSHYLSTVNCHQMRPGRDFIYTLFLHGRNVYMHDAFTVESLAYDTHCAVMKKTNNNRVATS